jgi:hypothetical protein
VEREIAIQKEAPPKRPPAGAAGAAAEVVVVVDAVAGAPKEKPVDAVGAVAGGPRENGSIAEVAGAVLAAVVAAAAGLAPKSEVVPWAG